MPWSVSIFGIEKNGNTISFFFFSSRRRHTRFKCDWSSDVCSSDLTRNPVRPFANPAFTGPVILGKPNQWFNPNAFLAPANTAANGGFYGNVGRDTLIGP